ncbi:MAG: DUF502 domain-containing protein [Chitinophagaceae bacterium]|jgi:uncharacterized membrane protein|nr:DUF502 domain-containing protein [Chitinophagaceae bacterium]
MESRTQALTRFTSRKILRYLVQGMLVVAPLAITAYVIYWLFDLIDGILRPYLNIPGLGFVMIVSFLILVGWISSTYLVSGVIAFFEKVLDRMPAIKFIYSSVKDFFEAFAGDKKKFDKAVLVNVFSADVWIIGFLTGEELEKFNLGADHVSVYVPQSYNFAGQLYILHRSKVKKIEHISSGIAMKFAVTGGVVELEDNKDEEVIKEIDRELHKP